MFVIPDEIEFGGNSYSLSGIEDADGDPKETKKTTKTETEETDDLILIYFDEIKAFLDKYLMLTAALMAALILCIYLIKRYRARYDLWW